MSEIISPKKHPMLEEVTTRIQKRSASSRTAYLERCENMRSQGPQRGQLACSNLAHGFAASIGDEKLVLKKNHSPNIGIVTAYNDMLSAHQPFKSYPELLKAAASGAGGSAQVAGGTPAMCDGVTQGFPGMEMSLFSRDVIAMSTAIALSHNMFDAALCLGVCDKIVPGLLIGALSFGHLPVIFVPAGPMSSGIPNKEKARIRQEYAEGKIGREELLAAESKAYHSHGTCTFYGTANSNQMLLEAMGLHLPGAAFVHPDDALRDALTKRAATRACEITDLGNEYISISEVVNEKCLVNAIVALLATGGSTNHTIHWIAIAKAAGILLKWDDFDDLAAITPLLAHVYPNGTADVNHFQAAGGPSFIIHTLIENGLMHKDVMTVMGQGLDRYTYEPKLRGNELAYTGSSVCQSGDTEVIRPADKPFSKQGGLKLLTGNLGRCIIKTSAVADEHLFVEAPALVFNDQAELAAAYKEGKLEQDFIAVVRFQGPSANGMPELHKMTPFLGSLQDRGFNVALVTDGRMSGASGKVPAAIHLIPEAAHNGAIARLQNGDVIRLDAIKGTLEVLNVDISQRDSANNNDLGHQYGYGRELFAMPRNQVSSAEQGASVIKYPD